MAEPRERRAFYMFHRDQAELVIQLPLAEEGEFDANEVGTWVGLLVDKVRPWAEPYRMAGVERLKLEAGPDMHWHPAREAAPVEPAAPAANGSGASDAAYDTLEAYGKQLQSWQAPPERDPAEPAPRPVLSQCQKEQTVLPTRPASTNTRPWTRSESHQDQIRQEKERIYQLLLVAGGEHRPIEIERRLAQLSPPLVLASNTLLKRLRELADAGRLTRRHMPTEKQTPTYYAAIPFAAPDPPPAPPRPPGPAPEKGAAARIPQRVLDYTRGKTMLFWGGKPPGGQLKQLTEATRAALGLKALIWPDYEKGQRPLRWKLAQLDRHAVDLMVITRFNAHDVNGPVAKAARDRKIPVFWLGATHSLTQLVRELDEQIVRQGLAVPTLRIAA